MSFRRFERDIQKVIQEHPRVVVFTPRSLKPSSYAKLFREACAAYCHSDCRWDSPIDRASLYTIWTTGRLTVRYHDGDGTVTIGPKDLMELEQASADIAANEIEISSAIDGNNSAILHAVMLLKNHDLISGEITLRNLPVASYTSLMQQYENTTLLDLGNGTTKLF